ncbi:hypothetical protein JZ751_014521 [Albula glossodonta]|uniref:NADP-dependent oxidoreductase domain-containing protein n=1 Tax=Albula glossodonta TaxID=121402 RepID=A0A8T2MXJ4_9TELE|nr:hypothetical protein JZ751_014521 [Albula glossodonta]
MAQVPKVRLSGGLEICRLLNGMWQVSGAHGPIDPHKAVKAMEAYVNAGMTSFDMADIYGPAEEIFGKFNSQASINSALPAEWHRFLSPCVHRSLKWAWGSANAAHGGSDTCEGLIREGVEGRGSSEGQGRDRPSVQGLTKWVPRPGPMDRKVVEKAIQRSMSRMQVDRLDCLQFHWWDYQDKRYLEALGHLSDLQQEGMIGELALTNFDTRRLEEITSRGIQISSNQVQYSIIDRRPAAKMEKFCLAHDVKLLTYGTLGGGLISERYLGCEEPKSRAELSTASLSKYKNMVDLWGGWGLFQELLSALDVVAGRHGCSIANVATKYVLDRPAVGGVIVGCRLGVAGAEHIQDNLRSLNVSITPEDLSAIDHVLHRSRDLMCAIGDCGDEYRH